MSRYPFLSASCNGVAPSLYMDVARSVLASGLAPRSRSSWTTCVWPNRAAKCNGVAPAMRRAALLFASAPLSNKARTVSTWPPRAAKWIGRYPSPKTSLISAPRSSSVKTVFVSPRYAAEDSTGRQPLSGANQANKAHLYVELHGGNPAVQGETKNFRPIAWERQETPLRNQHRIAIRVEPILLPDRFRIGRS